MTAWKTCNERERLCSSGCPTPPLAILSQQAVSDGKRHATMLTNAVLTQLHLPALPLGLLADVPNLRPASEAKLRQQQAEALGALVGAEMHDAELAVKAAVLQGFGGIVGVAPACYCQCLVCVECVCACVFWTACRVCGEMRGSFQARLHK